jgi:hypothetical protein
MEEIWRVIELTGTTDQIELRLRLALQLFHTLDPSPFRERGLEHDADDYIVGRALELPSGSAIAIVISLPQTEIAPTTAQDVASAINTHFDFRARSVTRELRELFRIGRQALLVGLSILSICLVLSWWLAARADNGPVTRIVQESFIILGWVAIWKPSDIFLYGWPPLARRRKLFRRLANANVTVTSDV